MTLLHWVILIVLAGLACGGAVWVVAVLMTAWYDDPMNIYQPDDSPTNTTSADYRKEFPGWPPAEPPAGGWHKAEPPEPNREEWKDEEPDP